MPPTSPDDFRDLVESVPHLVWVAAPDGAIEYLNRRCLEYAGRPMADLLGWDWSAVIHPDDLSRAVAVWHQSLKDGTPHEVEYRIRRHDGAYRWHVARALPFRAAGGGVVRWLGTCTDVDDLKRAEDGLRASEALFRALVERSGEGFALLGPDRAVRYASPAVAAILGYAPAEWAGPDVVDWAHPDDRPGLGVWLDHLRRTPGGAVEVWYRFRHRAGDYRWLEVRAANRLDDPAVAAFVVAFRDITACRPAAPARGAVGGPGA